MMNNKIHETAIIFHDVTLGNNVYIGPNCIIGEEGYQKQSGGTNFQNKTIIGNDVRICGGSVVCKGTTIEGNNRIDHQCYIGEQATIMEGTVIEYGARVYNNVIIGKSCCIGGFIANDCIIGDHCIIQGDLIHRHIEVEKGKSELSPSTKNHVFVGRNAQIIGPVLLAEYIYVAAGSIVTKSTIKSTFYVGIPAKPKGKAPLVFIK